MNWGQGAVNSFAQGYETGSKIRDRRRQNALSKALEQAYDMGSPETTNYDPINNPGMAPDQQIIPARAPGLDIQKFLKLAAEAGVGPEAIAIAQKNRPTLHLGEVGAGGAAKQSIFYDPATGNIKPVGRPYQNASGQATSLTEILDPADAKRMLRIDARIYRGGSLGSPGVIGISGKEPSAAKKAEQVDSGREGVSTMIAGLRDYYNQLKESGGITDPEASPLSNLSAGIASSGPGQAAGRLFGTQNQSLRNSIAQQRPLLLQAIKQATGMTAKQMDSNVELKLYLSAATDPTLDIQANLSALDNLEKLFGSGNQPQPTPPTPKAAPKPGQIKGGYVFKGGDPANPKSWMKQ